MIPSNRGESGLAELIDRILDKGLVINADIKIDLAGTELLGIKIRAALASFETAAKFGLAFPSGTNLNAPAWKSLGCTPEAFCPECGSSMFSKVEKACSCGWKSIALEHGEVKLMDMQRNESNRDKQENMGLPNAHRKDKNADTKGGKEE
ncbi:MAG: gas vesicle protein [Nanoarchaeota archaeon]|nr:gas vesicle protein [Nanoarchaeota archaeon]